MKYQKLAPIYPQLLYEQRTNMIIRNRSARVQHNEELYSEATTVKDNSYKTYTLHQHDSN